MLHGRRQAVLSPLEDRILRRMRYGPVWPGMLDDALGCGEGNARLALEDLRERGKAAHVEWRNTGRMVTVLRGGAA
jgi:hypothetical protein